MQFANPTPTEVRFKKLYESATVPKYTRASDACLDFTCSIDFDILPGETQIVPTGLAIQLPQGFEGRVRGRSGLSARGIHVHHGTIDEEYRGEIGIIMTNNTDERLHFKKGDRIAQFSICPVFKIMVLEVEELTETERGTNGFGSSDKVVA